MNPWKIFQPSILPQWNFDYTHLGISKCGMEILPGVMSVTQPLINIKQKLYTLTESAHLADSVSKSQYLCVVCAYFGRFL